MNNGLYVRFLFCGYPILTKFERCGYILVKIPKLKFFNKKKLTMGSARIIADGGMDGQTDMTRLLKLVE